MIDVPPISNKCDLIDKPINPCYEPLSSEKISPIIKELISSSLFQQRLAPSPEEAIFNRFSIERFCPDKYLSKATLITKSSVKNETFDFASLNSLLIPNHRNDFSSTAPDELYLGSYHIDQGSPVEAITDPVADALIDKINPQLKLSSGRIVLPNEFFQDPLFKDTKEKKVVFIKLYYLLNSPDFIREYQNFLLNLCHDKWFKAYDRTPEKLALLSLIAFYDGRINKEELFVINMVSSAFHEVLSPNSTLEKVEFKVLDANSIIEYLRESGFPPFAANTENHIIASHNRKNTEELEAEIRDFLQEYSRRSPVERTFTEYTLKNSAINNITHYSIEILIHYILGSDVGFKREDRLEKTTPVLPPPHFAIELSRWASTVPSIPAKEHHFMFGFSKSNKSLSEGRRPISIPSTLFKLPFVHESKRGPELGVLAHDLNYHMPLEVINPHIDIFVNIASKVKDFTEKRIRHSIQFSCYLNDFKKFCNIILDRETFAYKVYVDPSAAFWSFIYSSLMIFKNDFHSNRFLMLLEEIFHPAIFSAVLESGKDIRMLTFEKLKEALLVFSTF